VFTQYLIGVSSELSDVKVHPEECGLVGRDAVSLLFRYLLFYLFIYFRCDVMSGLEN
jgi:hypothetical protein